MREMAAGILVATGIVAAGTAAADSYTQFVIALIAITTIVCVGLNILLGMMGQISLGHVGFYAIGAYVSGILNLKGVNFLLVLPAAGLLTAAVGLLLALPSLRVAGPYLAMVTIAFAFIVEHGLIEWRGVTGGANGLMGITPPVIAGHMFAEREMALLAIAMAMASLLFYLVLYDSTLGRSMRAVRDAEQAAQSVGLNPVSLKTVAFVLSAALTGVAGTILAPLLTFISPGSFPFSQSILFLFAVMVGGVGSVPGPFIGALLVVGLPELLSSFAEYRLLLFGALLLVVLWLAPAGIVGELQQRLGRRSVRMPVDRAVDIAEVLKPGNMSLRVDGLCIAFGGVKAASGVKFTARPGAVTSIIGPNGAGKTTVLNMIGGFYRPDAGSIFLDRELADAPAHQIARAGIARTYQTTQLFGSMSVLDNVRIGLTRTRTTNRDALAEALLLFVGYRDDVAVKAGNLPHADKRLVEIARALATGPRVLLLDEPAAGLTRGDKDELARVIRRIADTGIAVILVEHDMPMVMQVSDHVVVLDAGKPIAAGTPDEVRADPAVITAYLGSQQEAQRGRAHAWMGPDTPVLSTTNLIAGYGAAPVLEDLSIKVRSGELVAILGTNGAGKSTAMRAISGLLRPVSGRVVLNDTSISEMPAYRIARIGLALVPEGREVFPELTVRDNIMLGAFALRNRSDVANAAACADALLTRFPRLRERIASRAGLLSGGEQQMLAIARGLMARPEILLLDEPSLGLAPALVDELFDLLAELRDEGVTILLVDQMASLALGVADRACVIDSGRVVREGSAWELNGDPVLKAAYLGQAEDQEGERARSA